MVAAISIKNASKRQGKFSLANIDLSIDGGLCLGLIGSNGAGKSTLIQCMSSHRNLDAGQILLNGIDVRGKDLSWKKTVGFFHADQGYHENLTILDHLTLFADAYPSWDPDLCKTIVDRFEVDVKMKVSQLSKGGRTILGLLLAFSHRPKILVLDEPTVHLDPVVRSQVIAFLQEMKAANDVTILIASHIITDIAAIADKVAFMKEGEIIETGYLMDYEDSWRTISVRSENDLTALPGYHRVLKSGPQQLLTTRNASATTLALEKMSIPIIDSQRISMDDIAVHILETNLTHKSESQL